MKIIFVLLPKYVISTVIEPFFIKYFLFQERCCVFHPVVVERQHTASKINMGESLQ